MYILPLGDMLPGLEVCIMEIESTIGAVNANPLLVLHNLHQLHDAWENTNGDVCDTAAQ